MRFDNFESFWSQARRKVAKKRARKCWEIAVREIAKRDGADRGEAMVWLFERWAAYIASPKAQGQFNPYPSSWLNAGCYDDDPKEWLDGGEQTDRQLSAADKAREEFSP